MEPTVQAHQSRLKLVSPDLSAEIIRIRWVPRIRVIPPPAFLRSTPLPHNERIACRADCMAVFHMYGASAHWLYGNFSGTNASGCSGGGGGSNDDGQFDGCAPFTHSALSCPHHSCLMQASFYCIFPIYINAVTLVVGNSNGVPCCDYRPHC
ncbi:hypothetical protein B0H14DRAFT_3662851 [Mycena olivaceomarginata]|nr:hypothetical protein B0H14DRAFT_3662851 [Mycena olivaceomarginata]